MPFVAIFAIILIAVFSLTGALMLRDRVLFRSAFPGMLLVGASLYALAFSAVNAVLALSSEAIDAKAWHMDFAKLSLTASFVASLPAAAWLLACKDRLEVGPPVMLSLAFVLVVTAALMVASLSTFLNWW